MPLTKGSSKAVIAKNIREMVAAGHPQRQAVAAALHTANPKGGNMAHSHYNQAQHHEQRMRDEGKDGKHMQSDGSVPIVGKRGARIHGEHTGEMANSHMPPTHQMSGKPMAHIDGMKTDSGMDRMKKGKRGDHEENA